MSKRILIIGGTGYIGSALYNSLTDFMQQWEDSGIMYPKYVVDTCDLEWFGNVVNSKNIKMDMKELPQELLSLYDVIILLAGHSSVAMVANSKGLSAFKNNVNNFMTLLPKMKDGTKFIYAGSASVYNGLKCGTESSDLKNPQQLYDLTKQEIDHYMLLNRFPKIEYYGLRMGTVCGVSPNMRIDTMTNMMINTAIDTGKIHVLNGHNRRPLLEMNELIEAITIIIDSEEDKRGIYNLCSYDAGIGTIAKLVSDVTGATVTQSTAEQFSVLLGGKVPPALDFTVDVTKFHKTFKNNELENRGNVITVDEHKTESIKLTEKVKKLITHTADNITKIPLLKSTRALGKDYE